MRDAMRIEHAERTVERYAVAREHDALRPVDRADRQRRADFANERFSLRERNRRLLHAPGARRALHDSTAMPHDAQRIVERQHARRMEGGDLADAVADDRLRTNAPAVPECRQRDLNREDRRLRDHGFLQARRLRGVSDRRRNRPSRQSLEAAIDVGERVAKHRLALGELATHARPLRALPAEHERDPRRATARPVPDGDRSVLAARERGELRRELLARATDDRETMIVVRATRARGTDNACDRLRRCRQEFRPPLRERAQARPESAPTTAAAARLRSYRQRPVRASWSFFDEHVRVRPADAEAAHTGHARLCSRRPRNVDDRPRPATCR